MLWLHPCARHASTHLSYNQFGDLATAVGKQLAAIGVKAGDRVALILNNSVEWAALYGASSIGAAAMYTHQHGTEWAYILGDSTCSSCRGRHRCSRQTRGQHAKRSQRMAILRRAVAG